MAGQARGFATLGRHGACEFEHGLRDEPGLGIRHFRRENLCETAFQFVHHGDFDRDWRGKLCSVRALRGIDSKVGLNKGLWGLAERIANGETLPEPASMALAA
jgi:hypothetical protein